MDQKLSSSSYEDLKFKKKISYLKTIYVQNSPPVPSIWSTQHIIYLMTYKYHTLPKYIALITNTELKRSDLIMILASPKDTCSPCKLSTIYIKL